MTVLKNPDKVAHAIEMPGDLAKKHRDEAIRGANKGAVEFRARRLTTSVSFGQASSFACKDASDGPVQLYVQSKRSAKCLERH